jgi:hypothetical protein
MPFSESRRRLAGSTKLPTSVVCEWLEFFPKGPLRGRIPLPFSGIGLYSNGPRALFGEWPPFSESRCRSAGSDQTRITHERCLRVVGVFPEGPKDSFGGPLRGRIPLPFSGIGLYSNGPRTICVSGRDFQNLPLSGFRHLSGILESGTAVSRRDLLFRNYR